VIASVLVNSLRVHVDGDITPALSSVDNAGKNVMWSKRSINRTRIPASVDARAGGFAIPVNVLLSKDADGPVVDLVNATKEAIAVWDRGILSLADLDHRRNRWRADGKIGTMAYLVHRRRDEDWVKSDGDGQRVEDLEHGEDFGEGAERASAYCLRYTILIKDLPWCQVSELFIIDYAKLGSLKHWLLT